MTSRYETNIGLQPTRIKAVLDAPRPAWMDRLKKRDIHFVGIGSSYFAARLSEWLWRTHVGPRAWAVSSFDFCRASQPVRRGDAVVVFSHRGTKSFSVEAAARARKVGAVVIGITGKDSPWKGLHHRLETTEQEDTGGFTKSLTAALVWVVRWIDDKKLTAAVRKTAKRIPTEQKFYKVGPRTDLVLLGDAIREWTAREAGLKAQETAWLNARAFGLEEFLHGPRCSVGPGSVVIGFSGPSEKRWADVRTFLKTVQVPFQELKSSGAAGWLTHLFLGQLLALQACKSLGHDPDSLRTEDVRYRLARAKLKL